MTSPIGADTRGHADSTARKVRGVLPESAVISASARADHADHASISSRCRIAVTRACCVQSVSHPAALKKLQHSSSGNGWPTCPATRQSQIATAITCGVAPDGRMLAPAMPLPSYAALAPENLDALVDWLRALPPVEAPRIGRVSDPATARPPLLPGAFAAALTGRTGPRSPRGSPFLLCRKLWCLTRVCC